ncbi:MAG: T9SS type A sorting domain-containing protein [candidate division KSB1 bacterium]|nr:T9SS type A sorting domain-containing protein [candidate division KSB1 bacterium]MDZ7345583.1 T9SS type A sorting domain-containing protein [candidate division KSB1 bacterium]
MKAKTVFVCMITALLAGRGAAVDMHLILRDGAVTAGCLDSIRSLTFVTDRTHALSILDRNGKIRAHELTRIAAIEFHEPETVVFSQELEKPSASILYQNYPNPFNSSTTITFTLPRTERIVLSLFNVQGRRVARLVDGSFSAGTHAVHWDGCDDKGQRLSSGVYFIELKSGSFMQCRKCLLVE